MKRQLSEIEALINQKINNSKSDMIPASLREIYSGISGEDKLVARELLIEDRVAIGVEYAPDKTIIGTYTTDKNGRRVPLDNNYEKDESNRTPQNLISELLDDVSKTLAREGEEAQNKSPAPQKAAPKTIVKRDLSKEELLRIKQLDEYKKNRRGC